MVIWLVVTLCNKTLFNKVLFNQFIGQLILFNTFSSDVQHGTKVRMVITPVKHNDRKKRDCFIQVMTTLSFLSSYVKQACWNLCASASSYGKFVSQTVRSVTKPNSKLLLVCIVLSTVVYICEPSRARACVIHATPYLDHFVHLTSYTANLRTLRGYTNQTSCGGIIKTCMHSPAQVEEDYQYEKYTREQVEKEQRRIEAERTERIRERMRDREALKWNNSRRSKIRAQERMDTGGESDVYPGRLRYVDVGR